VIAFFMFIPPNSLVMRVSITDFNISVNIILIL
jgi:hypothetical protein